MVETKNGVKRRGKKTKTETLSENTNTNTENIVNEEKSKNANENIVVALEESNKPEELLQDTTLIDEIIHSHEETEQEQEPIDNVVAEKPTPKKRGRKPKGGKIIQQVVQLNNAREVKPNIILHLKCSLKDLQSKNLFGSNLEGFTFSNHSLAFDKIMTESAIETAAVAEVNRECELTTSDCDCEYDGNTDIREIWKKLKVLEHNLHINSVENKKSACFWDSCEFDNPQIYIPKYFMNGTYHVYGCFCSPECAVAYLMEENIDSSIKFERYQLINHIYSKVYNYNKNIKPAPNPYYMLEKFYGNLSIQEYRSLLKNERLFLVVDKPLTRVMPELHEDNDDFIINNKIIPSNTYQVKKRLQQKKQTKVNILGERFGLVQS